MAQGSGWFRSHRDEGNRSTNVTYGCTCGCVACRCNQCFSHRQQFKEGEVWRREVTLPFSLDMTPTCPGSARPSYTAGPSYTPAG